MSQLILLGPQRHHVNVGDVVTELGLSGPIAVITAGWQEREAEVSELETLLGVPTINLMLHQRGEAIFRDDQEFREAHRTHMGRVKRLQDLYRDRLGHYLDAVCQLLDRRGEVIDEVLQPELDDAFDMVRRLDEQHLTRINEFHDEFWEAWPREKRPGIQDHFNELGEILEGCSAVVVAGGHVAVLLNRLRLLNLKAILHEKTVLAWGAGAMCLGKRVVLFHDSPPQGRGYAEMFEAGLQLFQGVLPLPNASQRLLLDDEDRIALLARRFNDCQCITLDKGARLNFSDDTLKGGQNAMILRQNGKLEGVKA